MGVADESARGDVARVVSVADGGVRGDVADEGARGDVASLDRGLSVGRWVMGAKVHSDRCIGR